MDTLGAVEGHFRERVAVKVLICARVIPQELDVQASKCCRGLDAQNRAWAAQKDKIEQQQQVHKVNERSKQKKSVRKRIREG